MTRRRDLLLQGWDWHAWQPSCRQRGAAGTCNAYDMGPTIRGWCSSRCKVKSEQDRALDTPLACYVLCMHV